MAKNLGTCHCDEKLKKHGAQYDNHQIYCPDYEEEIQMITANHSYTIQSVFRTLYRRNEWSRTVNYPALFNSSVHLQYRNTDDNKTRCHYYMSLYTTLMMSVY